MKDEECNYTYHLFEYDWQFEISNGNDEGDVDGCNEIESDGAFVMNKDGILEGWLEETTKDGKRLGPEKFPLEGVDDEVLDGSATGLKDGRADSNCDGLLLGAELGACEWQSTT